MTGSDIIAYLSIIYRGDWNAVMGAIHEKQDVFNDRVAETLGKHKSRFVTILDPEYPPALKETPRPPLTLFYRGQLSLVRNYTRCVSIVGSRDASDYGTSMAKALARGACENGLTVVSGLAIGIDTAAGEASVPYGSAVAVLGNGLDYYYPLENSDLQKKIGKAGLLLSEYPDGTPPTQRSFPARNRIIAGLSKGTVIVEAQKYSGTMITAAFALEFNRELAAVPQRAGEGSVCNEIIKEGGTLVETTDDLLFWLGLKK